MSVLAALLFTAVFAAYFQVMHRTGSVPGLGALASRDRNAQLFGSYYFVVAAATLGGLIWLVIAIFLELQR
jgi:hypothetical protein